MTEAFVDVLSDAVSAMEDNELDYVLIGGIDALAIIATNELDWDYVLSRAGNAHTGC